MSKFIKDLIKNDAFVVMFITFTFSLLIYLLIKSPTIKSSTEIHLDGKEIIDSTIVSDTVVNDSFPLRLQE